MSALSALVYPFNSSEIIKKKSLIKKELMASSESRKKIRFALLSGSTIGIIKEVLDLFLLNYNIEAEFFEGQYNRFYEETVFCDKNLAEFKPDFLYFHTTSRNLHFMYEGNTADWTHFGDKLHQTWVSANNNFGSYIIQNNFEMPPYRPMGNSDVYLPNGIGESINRLNTSIYKHAIENSSFYVNDINYLAAWYGLEKWWHHNLWYMYKYAFDLHAVPLVCNSISRIVKSVLGLNQKALALDMDNTLWSGVIGDVGVDNIVLGDESPVGMAFHSFQKYVKALSKQGIMLNIVSKNEHNTAIQGFSHPSSVLKESDFQQIKANWLPKNINISEIATEINIGLDAFVFVDDNPAERELINQTLNEITVINANHPDDFVTQLDWAGYFETTNFTLDDAKRNEYYKTEQLRKEHASSFYDYTDYLKSLEMEAEIKPFNTSTVERITQLINKTNQFNPTTKRYTQAEVKEVCETDKYITLYANLQDKFGNYGIVSALVGLVLDFNLRIDVWVMSCRVFKRDLEYAFFSQLIDLCLERGIKTITCRYDPTPKNAYVKNLFPQLGFNDAGQTEGGGNDYIFMVDGKITTTEVIIVNKK